MTTLIKDLQILVVEDNPGDFVLIEEYLTEAIERPKISHAETFTEAEKILNKNDFNIILLDLSLPDLSGEKLVKQMIEISAPIPIVVLTGYENQQFGLKTLAMGVADYLLKDEISAFMLGKIIAYSIERNRAQQSLQHSEKKYRDIFNLSPQPMYLVDMETLLIIDANEAAVRQYGYTKEEFLSLHLYDIRPDGEIPSLKKAIKKAHDHSDIFYKTVLKHQKKNGEIFDVEISTSKIVRDNQTLRMVLAEDISERLEAKSTLELSERRFKALVQEGSDMIGIIDEDFRFTYVSPSHGRIYESYIGIKSIDLIHPEDADRVEKALQQLPNEKRVMLAPYRIRDHEGNYNWFETIITNLQDEPAIEGYVANSRNVTQQIQREEKLRELSLVAAKTTDLVIITNEIGQITWANKAFEKLTGYTLDEVKGEKPGDFLQGPDTDQATVRRISNAIENQKSIEETILNYNKKGEHYWLEMSIDPIFNEDGNCTHFIAIERDVTEKIEREKALRKSLERYEIVSKATSDTIWDLDIDSDQMLYNNNINSMFGYKKSEVRNTATWWHNKIHPDDKEEVNKTLTDVVKSGDERFQIEYRFKAADGSYKHILDRAFVLKDETEKPIRMIGAMQDVTHEVEEEERLKLLESVVTNTNETVVITEAEPTDLSGRKILFVNEAFTKLTGYDKEYAIGKTLHFLNGPKTDQQELDRLRKAMKKYEPAEAEFINYTKDGEGVWLNISMVPVANNKGDYTHWVSIGRDVTEERKYQEEIKASLTEKETLLAEIHHRVKNNLAVVSGIMQLQAFDSDNEELQAKLYDSVVRIKTMATVHELLYQSNSFSRLEFSETLRKLVENVSETFRTDNPVELDIECEPVTVNINQAIPASLIVNEVITNAYKHAFKSVKEGKITFRLYENQKTIHIEINDNGKGFNEKDLLKGGSLGTHLIRVLCEQIKGSIEYKHKNGTTFTLEFEKQDEKSGIGSAQLF